MGPARETEGEHDYVKNKRRLNALKEEVESVTRKIRELTDEELEQVTGGEWFPMKKIKTPPINSGGSAKGTPNTGTQSNIEGEHDISKSNEELNKIKEEVEAVNEKLAELTEEEIAQVSGGAGDLQAADLPR